MARSKMASGELSVSSGVTSSILRFCVVRGRGADAATGLGV